MTTPDDRLAALEQEVTDLRRQLARVSPPPPAGPEPIGRRQLLGRLAAGAAGAMGAGLVLDGAATPAAAATAEAVALSTDPHTELLTHDASPTAHAAAFDAFAGSLPEFNPDALDDYAWVHEDFFGTNVTNGQVGKYGWAVATAAGGILAAGSNYQSAPGHLMLSTGTTGTAGLCALNLGLTQLAGTGAALPAFDFKTRIAPVLLNGTHQAALRWGLHNDAAGAAPTNGVYFEILSTSAAATVHCRSAKAGVRSDLDSTLRMAGNTWATYRIVSDGGGNVSFYVNGALVGTLSDASTLPSLTTEVFGPAFSLIKTAGAAGTPRQFRLDYAYLRWAVAR